MSSQIDRLRDHVIVCRFGRIGVMPAQGLRDGGVDFVILEQSEPAIALARSLQADATDETALRAAGIDHARTLATVLSNDAANVFITLSARSLNPDLEIIARGELPGTEKKLLQAGANTVVLPTRIGAERIAEMILYQQTARFIHGSDQMKVFEKVLQSLGLDIEVVVAAPNSPAIGMTIEAIEHQSNGAFFIVQITGAVAMRSPGRRGRAWSRTDWCWSAAAEARAPGRCSRRVAERRSGLPRGRARPSCGLAGRVAGVRGSELVCFCKKV